MRSEVNKVVRQGIKCIIQGKAVKGVNKHVATAIWQHVLAVLQQQVPKQLKKQRSAHYSMTHDVTLKDYVAPIVSEPYASDMNEKLLTSQMTRHGRTATLPRGSFDRRWAVRSMLWRRGGYLMRASECAIDRSNCDCITTIGSVDSTCVSKGGRGQCLGAGCHVTTLSPWDTPWLTARSSTH